MAKSKSGRLSRFVHWWNISMFGLCMFVVVGSAASTYTNSQLNASANRHTDAIFVVQDLVRNVERVQRTEKRMATTATLPDTSFDLIFAPVNQNLDDLRPLISPDELAGIERTVRAYESAIQEESALIAGSSLDASLVIHDTKVQPVAVSLLANLETLEHWHQQNAHDSRQLAQTLLILFRALGVIVLCAFLLIYDRQRRTSMARIRQQEQHFRTLIHQSTDIVLVTDTTGAISFVTPAAESAFGKSAAELVGTQLDMYIVREDRIRVSDLIVQSIMAEGRPITHELRFLFGDGSVRIMESVALDLIDNEAINGVLITSHDVTERKRLLESLHYQAHHDSLTGLPNRILLADRLEEAIKRADRSAEPVSVLYIDLNEFKSVNDRLGHAAGDELLAVAATKLRNAVRGTDTIARIGGDEFVVVLEQSDLANAEMISERIELQLQGVILRDEPHPVSASIGIAVRTDPQVDADHLLRLADAAMYQIKDNGRTHNLPLLAMDTAAD